MRTRIPGNLPHEVSSFVGRESEIGEIARALARGPLLTVTGPGGIGKTRLALRVAATLSETALESLPDGVWFVNLAPLSDPSQVVSAVASTLKLRDEAGQDLTSLVCDAVRGKQLLFLLDNCEHVVSACAELTVALLRVGPGVRVLATSREALGVNGERILAVRGLSLATAAEENMHSDSARLFEERARLVRPAFAISKSDAQSIEQLCANLEGIPLAIELAAARVRVMPVQQLIGRLEKRFDLLTGGGRSTTVRQQTLRAAIDWSYDLLGEDERALLRRMSVFAGGCSLDAAESVCAGPSGGVLDVLARLVDKSLIFVTESDGEARYRMLETIREYASEKLYEENEADETMRRYVDWAVRLVELAAKNWREAEDRRWVDVMDRESDNVRSLLQWALYERHDLDAALALSGRFRLVWVLRGRGREGEQYLREALAQSEGRRTYLRTVALIAAAWVAGSGGQYLRMLELAEEALAIAREIGDPHQTNSALDALGEALLVRSDFERASACFDECYEIRKRLGEKNQTLNAGFGAAHVAQVMGQREKAYRLFETTLAEARTLDNRYVSARVLHLLSQLDRTNGDLDLADERLEEALRFGSELGWKHCVAYVKTQMMAMAAARSEIEKAYALMSESLAMLVELGDERGITDAFETFAYGSPFGLDVRNAAVLFGTAARIREVQDRPLYIADEAERDRFLSNAEQTLGEEGLALALEEGRAMSTEQAVEYALRLGESTDERSAS
jgi:predicted ATPase